MEKSTEAEGTGPSRGKSRVKEFYNDSLYRNSIYLIATNLANFGGGFLFLWISTWIYTEEEVGLAWAVIPLMMYLFVISNLGLPYGLIRLLPQAGEKGKDMINSCLTLSGLISLVGAILLLGVLALFFPNHELAFLLENPLYIGAIILFAVAFTLQFFAIHAFVAERRAGYSLAQAMVLNLLRLSPIAFLGILGAFGILVSWGIGVIAAATIGLSVFLHRTRMDYIPHPCINTAILKDMLPYSLKNWVGEFLWSAPNFLLPVLVLSVLGAESNGFFYVGWQAASVLGMISVAISVSLFAEGSHEEWQLGQHVRKSFKLVLLLVLPAAALMFIIGDKILLLFGPQYSENSIGILRVMIIAIVPASINLIYLGVKRVEMNMTSVWMVTAFIAISTFVLSYFLVNEMNIVGVGIAFAASQGAAAIFTMASLIGTMRSSNVAEDTGVYSYEVVE